MRAAALPLLALCACGGERTQEQPSPPPPPLGANDGAVAATDAAGVSPDWLVDITPLAPRPELVAHPPVLVGDRVIIAGSRTDYRGLDVDTGAEAWARRGGANLSQPTVFAMTDVLLVHECDAATGAPPGRAVLTCYERIDPLDIAARSAGRIHVTEEDLGSCTAVGGAWRILSTNPRSLGLLRERCLFDADLTRDGVATRLHDPPPDPERAEDVVAWIDGTPWRQVIAGGKSTVTRRDAPPLPGLTVLAASHLVGTARGAAVVRSDSSLVHDYLAAYDHGAIAWTWPLPAPPDPAGRGGPIGLTATAQHIIVFFDGGRVARFTAPWARSTAP
ncbi:MAG TPA: hypothetical protein VM261_02560 [Kofleriaceae bacterium]|nr:hypothetical protein [Kofleriaceae bacterium]